MSYGAWLLSSRGGWVLCIDVKCYIGSSWVCRYLRVSLVGFFVNMKMSRIYKETKKGNRVCCIYTETKKVIR